jgi:hypothetical protein
LPESLASLARRSAFEIRDEHFRFDKEELLKRVERALRAPDPKPVATEPPPAESDALPAETEAPLDEPGLLAAEKTIEQESFRLVTEFQVAAAPNVTLARVTQALEAEAVKDRRRRDVLDLPLQLAVDRQGAGPRSSSSSDRFEALSNAVGFLDVGRHPC